MVAIACIIRHDAGRELKGFAIKASIGAQPQSTSDARGELARHEAVFRPTDSDHKKSHSLRSGLIVKR